MNASANSDPETALDKLFELATKLTEVMERGLGERGLSASRAEVLLVLDKAGAMVQRQLGQALRCTPRYVTALVDALEAEGLVERGRHPTDRRATLVSLTELGAAAAARMGAERQEAARWLLGDVPRADLGTFVAIADQVLERIGAARPTSSSPRPGSGTRAARPRPSRPSNELAAEQDER
ncbi:MAG TPA: MarR family transcriptional regulator [Acidimicrobiales bacterium]|nr:MarR family transcriptional regulator [Acidimicrobiales bacterium]